MQTSNVNYLNFANNMLKLFKASCYRLMYPLSIEAFACLEVWLLGHNGSVLLSVVAQALLCNLLCAGSSSSLLPAKPLTTFSGKSRLLCAGFCTEAHRKRRDAEGGLHL
jgi:hypothetical protein